MLHSQQLIASIHRPARDDWRQHHSSHDIEGARGTADKCNPGNSLSADQPNMMNAPCWLAFFNALDRLGLRVPTFVAR